MDAQPPPRSFWCFISYRHADNKQPGRQWATWLHQQIETYEVPADLVGTVNGRGDAIPERIFPVFRDEDELPADADLSSPIYRALDASKFLVVLCSPRAVQSSYVADEILYYKKIGRSDRVLAALLDGDPSVAFPMPLRHPIDAAGALIEDQHAEPIAADFRLPDDTEGWTSPEAYRQALEDAAIPRKEADRRIADYRSRLELGKLKIIAGVLGLPLGTLTQRDKAYQLEKERRRARIFRRVSTAMGVLLLVAIAAGVFAAIKKRDAETQRQSALAARDAEAAQRALAEDRRVEAEGARGVAETRRTEAEQAKTLAEQRRVESETRLARSNILLADRLIREGNTDDAVRALWEIPEHERQWEWGHLLGRAYPEASRLTIAGDEKNVAPWETALDPEGRRAAFWSSRPLQDEGQTIPGLLRWMRVEPDGSVKTGSFEVKHGVLSATWSRTGSLAFLDGDQLRVFSPEGKDLGSRQIANEDGGGGDDVHFLDDKGERLLMKVGTTWYLFSVSSTGFDEIKRLPETFEMERFGGSAPDGKSWVAVSLDTGATLYDQNGKVVDRFKGVRHSSAAVSADGTVAIGTDTEGVIVRRPDGKRLQLAPDGDITGDPASGATLIWLGKRLFVRTIHQVRSWNLGIALAPGAELSPHVWEFPTDEVTERMAVGDSWVAVSLVSGAISVSPVDEVQETVRLLGHSGWVGDMRFASTGCLASVGTDGTLRHWFPATSTHIGTILDGFPDPLFKGQGDGWGPLVKRDENVINPLPAAPGRPYGTAIKIPSPDGARHASIGGDSQLRLWKGAGEGVEAVLAMPTPGKRGEILTFSTDGRRIGGQFMTPGGDYEYQTEWTSEPWTRAMLGLDAAADWRTAYEANRARRFQEAWSRQSRSAPH